MWFTNTPKATFEEINQDILNKKIPYKIQTTY